MVALSRNIANKHATEMLLTGNMISATRAAKIGSINLAVPNEDLQRDVMEHADKIRLKIQHDTRNRKKGAFYGQRDMTLTEAYDYASNVMVENMIARDAEEGIQAFINKRNPEWQDI